MLIVELLPILFALSSSCIRTLIGKIQGRIMAKFGNQMSTELFDHVQRIVMPKGAIKDQGHHLEVIAHQLPSTTDRLLDETERGAQRDLSPVLIFAPLWPSPFTRGLVLTPLLRFFGVQLVRLFHHDRGGGPALHAHQG